jgi:CelD/BcsL family acetyltransferase involved in cellulose biosynthesis
MGDEMRVDVVRPRDLGPAELTRWDLVQQGHESLASPFLCSAFALAVADVRPQTRVAVVSDDAGRTAGFWPFERGRAGRAAGLATGLADVQGIVVPASDGLTLAPLLRQCGLSLFTFDHLLAEQDHWLGGLRSRYRVEVSPTLSMPDGFEAYLAGQQAVSRSLVQSTARKRRKLERECGPVRFELHRRDHALLETVLGWKSDQYRRTGRRDRFADPANRSLVHALLDLEADGFSACLSVLTAGDSVVAAHLGLRSRSTVAWWFPVYQPDYGRYSPGLILCLDLARTMHDERLTVLDLGKGDEAYKSRLANQDIRLLAGAAAPRHAVLWVDTARRWPGEKATDLVLANPRLRSMAREGLARAGRVRSAAARNRDRRG